MEPSTEHNWCDRRCERCPLEETCGVTPMQRQRAWVNLAHGRDPDDPEVVAADVVDNIQRAATLLEQAIEEEGLDAEGIPPPPANPLVARLLNEAGMAFVDRAHRIESHAIGPDVETLHIDSIVIAMKLARLAGYVEDGGPPATDAELNRLLIEHLHEEVRAALGRLRASTPADVVAPCEEALARIRRLVDQVFDPVPEEVRAYLQARVRDGTAPSPFCVRPPPP